MYYALVISTTIGSSTSCTHTGTGGHFKMFMIPRNFPKMFNTRKYKYLVSKYYIARVWLVSKQDSVKMVDSLTFLRNQCNVARLG